MDIRGGRRSSNIEDRRGMRVGRTGVGLSVGGVLFLLVLSALGINPLPYLGMATKEQTSQVDPQQPSTPYQESAEEAQLSDLARVVLGESEQTWDRLFGGQYAPTTLVLYQEATESGCGLGQAAMGPFYCPTDRKVYLDLTFFNELATRFGAAGDFAQAYVIAHEIGHHVQNLEGTAAKVHDAQQRGGKGEANALSVRMELQADCYAGVWAHDAAPRLQVTEQDVQEALAAANAIGDDRLQKQAQGFVVPDSFTHGTSQQRQRWFAAGFQSGDPRACNTFQTERL
ncbi:MAG TPA: neutral zinc metallopeptidase [Steroidobacteraceae bacterium]|nr:neutral zinc metallopeptidase [Steroidobacteraceae bacterium]